MRIKEDIYQLGLQLQTIEEPTYKIRFLFDFNYNVHNTVIIHQSRVEQTGKNSKSIPLFDFNEDCAGIVNEAEEVMYFYDTKLKMKTFNDEIIDDDDIIFQHNILYNLERYMEFLKSNIKCYMLIDSEQFIEQLIY